MTVTGFVATAVPAPSEVGLGCSRILMVVASVVGYASSGLGPEVLVMVVVEVGVERGEIFEQSGVTGLRSVGWHHGWSLQ